MAKKKSTRRFPTRSKYGNKKVVYKDITFDSKKEMEHYIELEEKLKKGKICNLRRQVPFVLIPTIYEDYVKHLKTKDKIMTRCKHRKATYVADFVYEDAEGKEYVVDTKGIKTEEYKLKKKMMYYLLGIDIIEV